MKRIPELDSLRGLAGITIILFHLTPVRSIYSWTAVDCFFVLSSYLITTILLEYRGSPGFFRNFYARRSLRIWPIYFLALFAGVAANSLFHVGGSLEALPYYLTYTQNVQYYWGGRLPDFIHGYDHTWSLALEEQYYLIWPIAVYLLGRRTLIALSLLALGVSVAWRASGLNSSVLGARCDGFALGGLLALLLAGRDLDQESRARWGRGFGALLAVNMIPLAWMMREGYDRDLPVLLFSIAFFAVVGLLVIRSGDAWLAPMRSPVLIYVGAISYGLYLYHNPVHYAVEIGLRKLGIRLPLTPGYPAWRAALEVALSFGVAVTSWHLIEKPILRLKKRFEYRQPDAPPRDDRPIAAQSPTDTQ